LQFLVFLYVPDVDALYEEITSRGVKAQSSPEDFEGVIRDFWVTDPDGNKETEIGNRRISD
jgi:predicted enzyme related to lactoylglutathione lyase